MGIKMYGKIFESIYDGSLACGDWEALIVFQQLIVLADKDGVVDMTGIALHRRTTLPLEIIEKGLKALQEPDPISRTKGEEGRRIIPIDEGRGWGWVIVNYEYYRDLASREDKRQKDKIRIAKKRAESKASGNVVNCSNVSQSVHDVAHIDVDVNEDIKHTSESYDSDFLEFWKLCPRKDDKKKASKAWNKLSKTKKEKAKKDIAIRYGDTDKKYIPLPSTYINGERWNDERPDSFTSNDNYAEGAL